MQTQEGSATAIAVVSSLVCAFLGLALGAYLGRRMGGGAANGKMMTSGLMAQQQSMPYTAPLPQAS